MILKNILKNILRYVLPLIVVSSPAPAQDLQQLTIGIYTESAPFVIDEARLTGYDAELLLKVFKQANIDITIIRAPVRRLPSLLNGGKIDAITAWVMPNIACHKSSAYRMWNNVVAIPSHKPQDINTISDLKGKIIGSFTGASLALSPEIDSIIASASGYSEISDSTIGARMLLHGRYDAYIGDYTAVSYFYNIHATRQSIESKLTIIHSFEPIPQLLCFSDEKMRDQFEKEFALFKASGEYEALNKKYMPEMIFQDP